MDITVSVTAPAKMAALTKAVQAYNASAAQPPGRAAEILAL